jgi:peroxiredoxin Q/BCP
MTLEIGDSAPEFTLPTDSQGEVSLADFKDRKNVVIYFYPKDDTPGCTTESKDFRDHLEAFDAANTVIIGISKDSVTSHDKFKAKHALNVALASDENGDVCERYGVWVEKNMYGKKYMGIQRATFLINTSGNLACIWPKVKVSGHVQEVLKTVQSLS